MDNLYSAIMQMFPSANAYIMAGALIFARLLGFFRFAPIFNRRDIPPLVKIPLALLVTIFIVPFLSPDKVLAQYRKRSGSISNHGYLKLVKCHYKLFKEADNKNTITSLFLTLQNLIYGCWKKVRYVKKVS